ncbi:MAG: gamma carbonic anhydrase family protein [Peptococcaceae bacterium]|jgi:carbonic anhydrase/acetyltransferase-like protein (isoleucine patch superfamily)|nr:gamma carbonic anhydrase family protein [Peptococcaceae bacterium]
MLIPYLEHQPQVASNVFIAPGAKIIGQVSIDTEASIWFNCVLRGDIEPIKIGKGTNIQDLSVIHTNPGQPAIIKEHVTVGHSCVLHGCTINENCLIGMGAIIMNGAVIGENSLVAAGSLIPERKVYPPNSLILGSPAKVVRELTEQEIASIRSSAARYIERSQKYLAKENSCKQR